MNKTLLKILAAASVTTASMGMATAADAQTRPGQPGTPSPCSQPTGCNGGGTPTPTPTPTPVPPTGGPEVTAVGQANAEANSDSRSTAISDSTSNSNSNSNATANNTNNVANTNNNVNQMNGGDLTANMRGGDQNLSSTNNNTMNGGDQNLNNTNTMNGGDQTMVGGDNSSNATTGDVTQNVQGGDQTVNQGDTNVRTGDTNVSTGPTTMQSGDQNVAFNSTYRQAANAAAPGMGTLIANGQCQTGKGFTAGIGLVGLTIGGGTQSVDIDDDCHVRELDNRLTMQESAEEHVEIITAMQTRSQENIARMQSATTIAVTGMQQQCNRQTATVGDVNRCAAYTDAAITVLFGDVAVKNTDNSASARVEPEVRVVTRTVVRQAPRQQATTRRAAPAPRATAPAPCPTRCR